MDGLGDIRMSVIPSKLRDRTRAYEKNRRIAYEWCARNGNMLYHKEAYSASFRRQAMAQLDEMRKEVGKRLVISDNYALAPTYELSMDRKDMDGFLHKGDIYDLVQYFEGETASSLFKAEAPVVMYSIGFQLLIRDPRNYMSLAGFDTEEFRKKLLDLEAERNGGKLWLKPSIIAQDLDVPVGMVYEFTYNPGIDTSIKVACYNGETMQVRITK